MDMWGNVGSVAAQIQQSGLVLSYSEAGGISIWSTMYRKLPIKLRRAIKQHQDNLSLLMRQGDHRLCPTRDLHRQYWRYVGAGRYECEKCAKLDAWL